MLPFFKLGPFFVSSYSAMALLGLIALTVTSILIFEKIEKKPQIITNRLLILVGCGFVFFVISAFVFDSLFHSIEKGYLVFGGITWLGGVVGGFPFTIWLIHKFCPHVKGAALESFSLLIPSISLGHAFGRVGCFLGGCCFGSVTDSILGVSYPEGSLAAELYPAASGGSLTVLPTQLFEAVFEIALFLFMIIFYKKLKKHYISVYCFGYGLFRFLLEFIRGDSRGSTGFFLTPSQCLSIMLIIAGVILLLYQKDILFRKLRKKTNALARIREQEGIPMTFQDEKALRALAYLQKHGIITQKEFDEKKSQLLQKE